MTDTSDNRSQNGRAVRYDEQFFSDGWFQNWETLKHVLSALLLSESRWRKILDYGCGPGVMIDFMNGCGIDYVGCDVSPEARRLYLERFGKNPAKYLSSIDTLPDVRFDVMISFDVLEHMRDEEIAGLLGQIPRIPEILVNISRVRSIPGHINLKGDRAWLHFFESLGWVFELDRTARLRGRYVQQRPDRGDLWHQNLFLFRRADPPTLQA